MTKEITVTYAADVKRKGKDGKDVIARKKGETRKIAAEASLGLIAAMEAQAIGGSTQTTNPTYPRDLSDETLSDSQRTALQRSFVVACAALPNGGSPDDVYEYKQDGVVYRRATRGSLTRMLELCNQIDALRRQAVGLVEQVAPLPAKTPGEKKEKGDEDDLI